VNSYQILAAVRAWFDTAILAGATTNLELENLSRQRKGLRVTHKAGGAQRDTYLLQLSIHVAISAQVLSTLFAWLMNVLLYGQLATLTFLGDTLPIPALIFTFGTDTTPVVVVAVLGVVLLPLFTVKGFPLIPQLKFNRWQVKWRPLRDPNMPYPADNSRLFR
jgi:hypothetical protein